MGQICLSIPYTDVRFYINIALSQTSTDNSFVFPDVGEPYYYASIDISTVGYIGPLDLQGDGFYEYNMYMEWSLQTNVNHFIMMNILYVDIERSPKCYKDFLMVRIIQF